MNKNHHILDFITKKAAEFLSPNEILLFGSQARNTASDRSDFDIAIDSDCTDEKAWASFFDAIREHAPTLRKIDIVHWQKASEKLKAQIKKEGKSLYQAPRR